MDDLLQNLLRSVQRSDIVRAPVPDLRAFLDSHASLFRKQAGHRPINVKADAIDTPLSFDKGQIGRALDNLILNAIQNSGDGTPIDFKGFVRDGVLHLAVSDRGRGVPDMIREHLFEPMVAGIALISKF